MSGRISKDSFVKRLRIGVKFDGARIVLLNGKPLPELAKGSVGELVLAPECFVDGRVRAKLTGQTTVQFAKKGALVMVGVSPAMIGDVHAVGLIQAEKVPIISGYYFVEVKLNADLWAHIRGDHASRLAECACTIPTLGKVSKSLNRAINLISEAYETRRLRHTGSTFERVFTKTESGRWQRLEELKLLAIQKTVTGSKSRS